MSTTGTKQALRLEDLDALAMLELPEREVMRHQWISVNVFVSINIGIQICQFSICQFNQFG